MYMYRIRSTVYRVPTIENELRGMSMCWCSRIVGVAWLLFESSHYFVQHFWRCSDYLRAATNQEQRLIERIWYVSILTLKTRGGRLMYIYVVRTLHHTDLGCQ